MQNNVLSSGDINHAIIMPESPEEMISCESKQNATSGDIDEMIFPDNYFYVSQR